MRLSFQDQYEIFQRKTSDADATNLAAAKDDIRIGQRKLETSLGGYLTEEERSYTTVDDAISGTSSQSYKLPENFKKFIEFYVTVGTNQYPADLIQDDDLWREINAAAQASTNNCVEFCHIRYDRIELCPIPSSAKTATFRYEATTKPLSQDDYVTGTITTLANGAAAVTGDSTVWTAAMIGRYFKINDDGGWYKIASRTSNIAIALDVNYQGASIAAGTSTYTIGQMPLTPPDTHILPVYYAVWMWALFRKDTQLAREHERLWKEGVRDAQVAWANQSSSNILKSRFGLRRGRITNPNWYPTGMS